MASPITLPFVTTLRRLMLERLDDHDADVGDNELWQSIATNLRDNSDDGWLHGHEFQYLLHTGIPPSFRNKVWLLLNRRVPFAKGVESDLKIDGMSIREAYKAQSTRPCPPEAGILRDLHKTLDNELDIENSSIFRVLKATLAFGQSNVYISSIASIASVLLSSANEEESTFILTKLLFGPFRSMFIPNLPGLKLRLWELDRLAHQHLPQVVRNLEQLKIPLDLIFAPHFLTFFCYQFPLETCRRVMDVLVLEGPVTLVKVAFALLVLFEHDLASNDRNHVIKVITDSFRSVSVNDLMDASLNVPWQEQQVKRWHSEFNAGNNKSDSYLCQFALQQAKDGYTAVICTVPASSFIDGLLQPELTTAEIIERTKALAAQQNVNIAMTEGGEINVPKIPPVQSLVELFSHPQGPLIFSQYLQSIGCSDVPVIFFLASMDFHNQAKRLAPAERMAAANLVVDAFLRKNATVNELGLSSLKLVQDILDQLENPPPWLFDAAASDAFGNMDTKHFAAFKASKLCQDASDKTMKPPHFLPKLAVAAHQLPASDSAQIASPVELLSKIPMPPMISQQAIAKTEQLEQRKLELDKRIESHSEKLKTLENKISESDGKAAIAAAKEEEEAAKQRRRKSKRVSTINPADVAAASKPVDLARARSSSAILSSSVKPISTATSTSTTSTTSLKPTKSIRKAAGSVSVIDVQRTSPKKTKASSTSPTSSSNASSPARSKATTKKKEQSLSVSSSLSDSISEETSPVNGIRPTSKLKRFTSQGMVFDRLADKWMVLPSDKFKQTLSSKRFTVATYNINKDGPDPTLRFYAICQHLQNLRADIIMLQEATDTFLKTLRDCGWVRQSYHLSDTAGSSFAGRSHGQVIMSRLPFDQLVFTELRSRCRATAIVGVVVVNNRRIGIATVDLDPAPEDNALRCDQLITTLALLKDLDCVDFFVGGTFSSDLSFEAMANGSDLFKDCVDLWEKHFGGLLSSLRKGAGPTTSTTTIPTNPVISRLTGNVPPSPASSTSSSTSSPLIHTRSRSIENNLPQRAKSELGHFKSVSVEHYDADMAKSTEFSRRVSMARRKPKSSTNLSEQAAGNPPNGINHAEAKDNEAAKSKKKEEAAPADINTNVPAFGFTVNTKQNPLARAYFERYPVHRPDRLLMYSSQKYWGQTRSLRLFGNEQIAGRPDLFPSAHYGVLAVMEHYTPEDQPVEVESNDSRCVIS